MSSRPVKALIEDILEAIGKIDRYLAGMDKAGFLADSKTVDSVIRNLEIIGEATKRLPKSIKDAYPSVPWGQIVGLRNRVIHDYFGVDLELVWTIVKNDMPSYQHALAGILQTRGDI